MPDSPQHPHPPVVLVTGASRGIGRAIAVAAAGNGWSVAVHYGERKEEAERTRALCLDAAADPRARFVPVQARLHDRTEADTLTERVVDAFGRVDAFVSNAGIAPPVRADVLDVRTEDFDHVLDVNLRGAFLVAQRVARMWVNDGERDVPPQDGTPETRRSMVFVTSVSAEMVSTARAAYCASKAGLAMLAQVFAVRLAPHGIPVYDVRPGIIDTDMTAAVRDAYDARIAEGLVPARRWGTVFDVGRTVSALLSGQLPFSTGAVIPVDGGLRIPRL